MRGYILNAHTTNTAGSGLSAMFDNQYLPERRVWIDPDSTIGGATVAIQVQAAGDDDWKPTGISFTAATDAPQMLAVQPGDLVRGSVTGGTSANITVKMA
jgi:hypothetical protein